MTAMDELRRLLDERGVEYTAPETRDAVWYQSPVLGAVVDLQEDSGYLSMEVLNLITPQQALDATLGRGECRMTRIEDEQRILYGWLECSECGPVYPPTAERIQDAVKFCPFCGQRVVTA